jgi:hypothetical protein
MTHVKIFFFKKPCLLDPIQSKIMFFSKYKQLFKTWDSRNYLQINPINFMNTNNPIEDAFTLTHYKTLKELHFFWCKFLYGFDLFYW